MKLRFGLSLALGVPLLLGAPTGVHAQNNCTGQATVQGPTVVPFVIVCVNGKQYEVPGVVVDGKIGLLRKATVQLGGGAYFEVSANFNSDPFSNFTFGSVLPSGFGTFTFDAYFTTLTIGGPYNTAHSYFTENISLASAVGAAPGSGTVSPGSYPAYVSGSTDLGTLGVDVGTGSCTVSVVSTVVCPPGDKVNTIAPISPTLLTARLSYSHTTTGTGATSTVGWTGGVELTNVTTVAPEPATVAMMSIGLLLVGAAVQRKRKQL